MGVDDVETADKRMKSLRKSHGPMEYAKYALSPVCMYCKNLNLEVPGTCAAFPDGIPDEIYSGRDKHTSPFPGDHGIRFERAEE
jgi:hypothetical protein